MKIDEMRDKEIDELRKLEHETYDQLFKLRFQLATNQIENPARVRVARRELARIKTVISEKRRAAQAEA